MLAHALALAVGLGSFTLYIAAFFFPEVHRKHDFFWSGLGMFYALVLWACSEQMTGAVLLGQVASVTLLGYLGWQMLVLRRDRTPLELQTPATAESWQGFRDEMSTLTQDFLSQTPLGRVLGLRRSSRGPAKAVSKAKIRASSVKDVGYEFLDTVEEELELQRPANATVLPVGNQAASPSAASPSTAAQTATPAAPARGPGQSSRPRSRPAASLARPAEGQSSASSKGQSGKASNSSPGALGQAAGAAAGLRSWFGSLVGSTSRSKPSRAVIEIPPREPSVPLPRKKRTDPTAAQPEAEAAQPTAAPTSDIDFEDDAFWGDGEDTSISESSVAEPLAETPVEPVEAFASAAAEAAVETNLLAETDSEPKPQIEALNLLEESPTAEEDCDPMTQP